MKRAVFLVLASLIFASPAPQASAHSVHAPYETSFNADLAPGTIVVSTAERKLYLTLPGGRARVYPVGVGKQGLAWKGKAKVGWKQKWPRWTPTKNMIRREPDKYARYADGMPGGPGNPLGARALYLHKNGRDTMYRIHGTNAPSTIGSAVSNGCVRLLNEHIADLYSRVRIGATVVVL